ncbi:MAG TPA: efflux RND transporter periplasmic adaptor subunit [Usitatibacteraceae bacterium]|nr:efflux RND transporter periplasmic adaptor subunit [Usitatibacteraceae bacterium]
MNKTVVSLIALAAIGAASGIGYWAGRANSPAQPATAPKTAGAAPGKVGGAPPGTVVEAQQVRTMKLPGGITAIGTLRSQESVSIRSEVSGRISEFLFQEGQRVEKDAVLVRLDAAVQRAEWQQAEANLGLAKSRLERARDLFGKNFISAQARDEAESNFQVAKAAFDLASARLTKLEIRAPFSGTVGLRQVSIGDYIKDGQDIANLEAIDTLKVDFRVPEVFLKQVSTNQNLQVTLDAFPDQVFTGRVLAINPLLDAGGRAIVVRAAVRNSDARLRPGMFARVRLLTAEKQDTLTIPEQAIIPSGDEFYVFRILDERAVRTKVEIGQRGEGIVEIVNGLAASDTVVTAGQIKIRDGAPVRIAEAATPAPAGATMPAPAPGAKAEQPAAARKS